MGDEKTYIKKDLSNYMPENTKTGDRRNREKQIELNLPETVEYKTVKSGGYQGSMAIIVRLDGYWWFTEDIYGSCTGCDFCMGDPKGWTDEVLRSAYCFETLDDLKQYIRNSDARAWTSGWESLNRGEVISAAEKMQNE